ncbi:MAG TPA: hypothetical protein PLE54_04320 [Burkholderiaceae bacterium]|nr:hypothetical protein [Burkholderiaceae bacterium]HQR69802.1 hypothetical protein [Burkholderiaceae bacterium]
MSTLHLIRDGMSTAAELAALLFMAPIGTATAADLQGAVPAAQIAPAAEVAPPRPPALRPLHLVDGAFEMRLLGLLADLRVTQTVRNDTATTVDLGRHLPAASDGVDSVSVTRDGRSLELLDGGCGNVDVPDTGHARPGADEVIAELMQLPPGQRATIDVVATETLRPAGHAWRVALPATVAPMRPQALLIDQPEGGYVVVIPPTATGAATVTLRPADAPSRQYALGTVEAGSAYVIPVTAAEVTAQLAAGAVEIEVHADGAVLWTTLPIVGRDAGAAKLADTAH